MKNLNTLLKLEIYKKYTQYTVEIVSRVYHLSSKPVFIIKYILLLQTAGSIIMIQYFETRENMIIFEKWF